MNQIPKILHYCWLSNEEYPEIVNNCIRSWKKVLPQYEIVKWDRKKFDVTICQYTKEAYEAGKWAFVSDYVRLYALYNYGGIYLDSDIEVIKSFDALLGNEAFTGFENKSNIAAWILASKKKNPLFKEFLEYYTGRSFYKENNTMDLTPNPVPLTKICLKKGLFLENKIQFLKNITVYPIDYFCPKNYNSGKIKITKNTYCIHHFNGGWKDTKDKEKEKRRTLFCDYIGENLGVALNKFISTYEDHGFWKTM